jgi:hypothetical protein
MADVTVASTTDDQAAVNQAAGLSPAGVQEEQAKPQPGSGEQETLTTMQEAEETAEVEVEGEETEQEEQPEQVRRPKNAVQKRIDKLTAKNYALEEEKQQLEDRLTRLERAAGQSQQQAVVQQGPQFQKPRPVQTDAKFKDYDEFIEALTDWKLEKKDFDRNQEAVAQQQQAQQQRLEQTFRSYNQAAIQFKVEHEDFDEVVGREDLQLPISVMNAIVGLRDRGPEISYQVAQDEDLCNHLSQMSVEHGDAVALTEFGRWLASMEQEPVAVGGGEAEERPVARRSSAPAPIKPVGNSSTRSQKSLDELDFRDYRRIRDEAERARYRH